VRKHTHRRVPRLNLQLFIPDEARKIPPAGPDAT
jgi:hypothetical protein